MATLDELSVSLPKVTRRSTLSDIIQTADFNLPDIDWETGTVRVNPRYSTTIKQRAIKIMTDHHPMQLNLQPTRFDHILDLLITAQPGMSDHDIMTTVTAYPQRTKKNHGHTTSVEGQHAQLGNRTWGKTVFLKPYWWLMAWPQWSIRRQHQPTCASEENNGMLQSRLDDTKRRKWLTRRKL